MVKKAEFIKQVEVIKEAPIELRQFKSLKELDDWLQQVHIRIRLRANSKGIAQLQGKSEEVAKFLQDRAAKDGYKMSVELLGSEEYHKWYGKWLDEGQLHAVNSTIIGNEVWFIDFAIDKLWPAAYLDSPN